VRVSLRACAAGEASLQGLKTNSSLMDVFQFTGFCPQLKGLYRNLTLRQHLRIILRLKGLSGEVLEQTIVRAVAPPPNLTLPTLTRKRGEGVRC
jgi:ABC-type multidrug transport system ATPase subunit